MLGDEKLSANLRRIIASEKNELWLSPISILETLVLAEKGRLKLNSEAIAWVKRYLKILDVKEARLTYEIAILSLQKICPVKIHFYRFIAKECDLLQSSFSNC